MSFLRGICPNAPATADANHANIPDTKPIVQPIVSIPSLTQPMAPPTTQPVYMGNTHAAPKVRHVFHFFCGAPPQMLNMNP